MSKEITNNPEMPEQLSDILLVLDKEKMKIQAVKSIDENGKMETVDPTKKNQNQFMRVDKNGDVFSNFFSNFFSQLKNPTNFSFFKVPAPVAVEKAQEMQKQVDKPTPEGEKVMKEHEVKTELQQDAQRLQRLIKATDLYNPVSLSAKRCLPKLALVITSSSQTRTCNPACPNAIKLSFISIKAVNTFEPVPPAPIRFTEIGLVGLSR